MKQGTVVNRIVMLLFLAAIVIYFGGAAWRGLRNPYSMVQTYPFAVEDTVEATGYLVREEQVLTGSGDIVRLIPSEGEKVAAGAVVALLYADEESLERSDQLKILQVEVEQLSAAIAAGASGQEEGSSGQEVADTMIALRSAVAAGDLTRLESQVTAFKSAVYQRAQRYGSADDLSAALASAQAEIDRLQAQTTPNTGQVAVTQSGIFSGQVDGYEGILTPEGLALLHPSEVDKLESRAAEVGSSAVGKLITDSVWYFICPLSEADGARLTEGGKVTVRFSRDWSGEVDMTVEHISSPENGRVAVTFSSNRFLSDTTLLRRQTVELIFDKQTGIRVPTAAVRMGENGTTGVYVQVGVTAEFKPVDVLAQGEDYYLVKPVLPENATDKTEKKALRAGDIVIIASEDIWDGKVLE
mgnify:CR=1 FL=1